MKNVLLVFLTFTVLSTSALADKKQVWVYTSIYKEYAEPLEKAFETKYPDIDVQVFQAGSEKIQAKVEAEILTGTPQADIILTSNPFWGQELSDRGLSYSDKKIAGTQNNYYSLMILITNKSVPANERPSSFADLTKPQFKNQVQMGSPLESGTSFSTVAYLSQKLGWDYFKKLRENNLAANGGNSTVIQKVESGEKKFGVVLLENALAAQKRQSPIEVIYPNDGSFPIPSVQTIMKNSKNIDAAKKFSEFVLSPEGQNILISGYMYSVRKELKAPEGAQPFSKVTKNSNPWNTQFISKISKDSKEIKKKFSDIVLN